MSKLLPIITFALLMAVFSECVSKYRLDSLGEKVYVKKDAWFYYAMALGMAIFVGLRTAGNDTYTYRQIYENINLKKSVLSNVQWRSLSTAPGHSLLSSVLKHLGASTQDYIMICALFTVIVYLWFIRKYTNNIWLSIFYFITMGVYTFSMAAIKQTLSVAILLIATDKAIEKKWIQFFFFVCLAELFHPFAFIYMIVPFLFFVPWGKRTYLLFIGTIGIAASLSSLIGNIMMVTDALGANYSDTEFIGEGVNIFRVLVVWIPVILSFFGREYIRKSDDRALNLIINASTVNALIMFVGLFGTANYFARLANYFLIFQTLSLPWVLRIFEKKSRQFVFGASVVCYLSYFYYQCVLANGAFDTVYKFMSLGKYLTELLS